MFSPGEVSFLSEAAHSGVQQPQGKRSDSRAGSEGEGSGRDGRRSRTFVSSVGPRKLHVG